jgi:methyl-accepting chemotaxis protein
MNMSNLNIGTRLGLGFGFLLLLMSTLTGIGVWRLYTVASMAETLVKEELRQERYVAEWLGIIEANAVRTYAAAKVNDPESEKFFVDGIAAKTVRAGELLKLLEAGMKPEGKPLMAALVEKRAIYQSARAAAFKMKAAGDMEGVRKFINVEMQPKLDAFVEQARALRQFQTDSIDAMGRQVDQQHRDGRLVMFALTGLALLLGTGYAWWISRSITTPMRRAVQIARTVAEGDLTSDIAVDSKDETGQLLLALKDMNNGLVTIVAQVRTGTDTIAHASSEIASGNLDLSSRTEQQAGSLEKTASAIEELTSTVRQNGDNARQANQLAVSASDVAVKGGQVVSNVVSTMGEINASAKKMADIISVIDGIAFQTNILALNAAVEAARAGEQGRGFAVVASEVRTLAQRSAAAAKEIKVLIDTSVERVDAGSRLVTDAGSTMDEIVASVKRVTDIMSEITAASQEQITGIEQINDAVTQMDAATQQNAALVEEAAAAAESLQDQARGLADVVSIFKLDDNHAPHGKIAERPMAAGQQRLLTA